MGSGLIGGGTGEVRAFGRNVYDLSTILVAGFLVVGFGQLVRCRVDGGQVFVHGGRLFFCLNQDLQDCDGFSGWPAMGRAMLG